MAGVMLAGKGWQAGALDVRPCHRKTAGVLAVGTGWSVGTLNGHQRPVIEGAGRPGTARTADELKLIARTYPGYAFWWDSRGDADPVLTAERADQKHTAPDVPGMYAVLEEAHGRRP